MEAEKGGETEARCKINKLIKNIRGCFASSEDTDLSQHPRQSVQNCLSLQFQEISCPFQVFKGPRTNMCSNPHIDIYIHTHSK